MNVARHPRTPYIKAVRSMVKADIESLRQPSARPRLANIRDVHHIIARLLVSGLSLAEVAEETGYSMTRISVIRSAPAMVELIEQYRGQVTEDWREQFNADEEAMFRKRRKASRIIEEYLDDHEENPVPLKAALSIYDSLADRTGFHRRSAKDVNINNNFAARLDVAIAASKKVRYIDGD